MHIQGMLNRAHVDHPRSIAKYYKYLCKYFRVFLDCKSHKSKPGDPVHLSDVLFGNNQAPMVF